MENWYIIIDGATLGPFEKEDLKHKFGFTPDTLVWRDGFEGWIAARQVPELDELFKDEKNSEDEPLPTVLKEPIKEEAVDEALVLENREPPFLTIWFVIAILIFIYLVYELYFNP